MSTIQNQLDIRYYNEHNSHVSFHPEKKLRDLEEMLKVSDWEISMRIETALDSILLGSNYNHSSVYYLCIMPNRLVGHYTSPRHGINLKIDSIIVKQFSSDELTQHLLTHIKDEVAILKGEKPKPTKETVSEKKEKMITLGAHSSPALPGFHIWFEDVPKGEELKRIIELNRILKHSKEDLAEGIKEWFAKLKTSVAHELDTNCYFSLTFHVDVTVLFQKPTFGVVLSLDSSRYLEKPYTVNDVIQFIYNSVRKQIEAIETFLHLSPQKNR